jgi:hypothetical protein
MKGLTYLTIGLGILLTGCADKEDEETSSAPDVYQKIYGASDIYVQGDYGYIKTTSNTNESTIIVSEKTL